MSDTGNTFYNRVEGFEQVTRLCVDWRTDYAQRSTIRPARRILHRPYRLSCPVGGERFVTNRVEGFDEVEARATAGGTDIAYLYDSSGTDTFTGGPTSAQITNANSTFLNRVQGFDNVYGYSTLGGNDVALLSGSNANDSFEARPTYAILSAGTIPYYLQANDFHRVTASATGSGVDRAFLYDSAKMIISPAGPIRPRVGGGQFFLESREWL